MNMEDATTRKEALTAPSCAPWMGQSCVACGGDRFRLLKVTKQTNVLVCRNCRTAITDPTPSNDQLEGRYSQEYYGSEHVKFTPLVERAVLLQNKWRARWIGSQLHGGRRILEVGCGRGALLEALAELGHECHGTERSNLAAARARKIQGLVIHTLPLAECGFSPNSFDAVVLWHVLEHLDHPRETLRCLFDLLKPGGKLFLEVPNVASWQARLGKDKWFHLDIDRHLYHFSPQGLTELLERIGFSVKMTGSFSVEQGPFGALQTSLNLLGFPRELLYKIMKREVQVEPAERIFSYGLAAALLFPATLFAWIEALRGCGAVIRVVAVK